MSPRVSPTKRLVAAAVAASLLFASPARALSYYSNDPTYGVLSFSTSADGARVGAWIDVSWEAATSKTFDSGTSLASFAYPNYEVRNPGWWWGVSVGGIDWSGTSSVRYFYRTNTGVATSDANYENNNIYFHVTYLPDYSEGNLGFGLLAIRGCWVVWDTLPSSITSGDTVSPAVLGRDDDGMMSSVTVQVSTNGGGWSTFMTGGTGASGYPSGSFTAGAAGTTYQFRAWATDTNGYQSHIITSGVYTTLPPPPPVNYLDQNGYDLSTLFKARNGGARASDTGMACVIGGVTYDLADQFLQRVTSPRAAVGYTANNGQDLSLIFEKK